MMIRSKKTPNHSPSHKHGACSKSKKRGSFLDATSRYSTSSDGSAPGNDNDGKNHKKGSSRSTPPSSSSLFRGGSISCEFQETLLEASGSSVLHQRLSDNVNLKELTMNKLRYHRLEETKIPVGREEEYELLKQRIKAVAARGRHHHKVDRELFLLSGYSGVGKSKLASSIQSTVEKQGGVFVLSKFDYLDDTTTEDNGAEADPYGAVSVAFNRICRDIYRRRADADGGEATQRNDDKTINTRLLSRDLKNTLSSVEITLLEDIIPYIDLLHQLIRDAEGANNESGQEEDQPNNYTSAQTDTNNNITKDRKTILFMAVRKFLRVIAKHVMLCIVLDDVQWTDTPSLELLQDLLQDNLIRGLMVVACYRSNEMDETHPWSDMIKEMRRRQSTEASLCITDLELENLSIDSVNKILTLLLNMDGEEAHTRDLAEACHARTQGNAYFLLTFLEMLLDEALLRFNLGTFRWTWDSPEEVLQKTVATANTVSLLMDKMSNTSRGCDMTRLLPIAACLGSSFYKNMLQLVWKVLGNRQRHDKDKHEHDECCAVDHGASFEELVDMAVEEKFLELAAENKLCFCHDKVCEAARGLLSEEKFEKLKVCVGAVMLHKLEPKELDASIFTVVNLMNSDFVEGIIRRLALEQSASNFGSDHADGSHNTTTSMDYCTDQAGVVLEHLLKEASTMGSSIGDDASSLCPFDTLGANQEEEIMAGFRIRLAQLNLQAAEKAKRMSAFHSAAQFAEKGLAWLDPDHKWIRTYDLTLSLCNVAAFATATTGDYVKADIYSQEVLNCERCPIPDKLPAYRVLVCYKGNSGHTGEAADICLQVLEELGVKFAKTAVWKIVAVLSVIFRLKKAKCLSAADVEAMPIIKDRRILAIMSLLDMTATYTYMNQDEMTMMLVLNRMRKLSIKHGLCKESPCCFAFPAYISMFLFGDFETGVQRAEAPLAALECLGESGLAAVPRTTWQIQGMCYSWVKPVASRSAKLQVGYRVGLQVGDTESAAISAWSGLSTDFLSGRVTLQELVQACNGYLPQLEALQRINQVTGITCLLQLALNLSGEQHNTTTLTGDAMDEAELLADLANLEAGKMNLLTVRLMKQIACTHFGDHETGAGLAFKRGDEYLNGLRGSPSGMICPVMRAVSLYTVARTSKGLLRLRCKREAKLLRSKVAHWVKIGNVNLAHMLKLLHAENHVLAGRAEKANASFREARVIAARSGFRQDAAMICQRHAEFLLARYWKDKDAADRAEAALQMEESIRYYAEWGALNKVRLLREEYSALLVEQDWDQLARAFVNGLEIKTRTYHLRKYKKCFVGGRGKKAKWRTSEVAD